MRSVGTLAMASRSVRRFFHQQLLAEGVLDGREEVGVLGAEDAAQAFGLGVEGPGASAAFEGGPDLRVRWPTVGQTTAVSYDPYAVLPRFADEYRAAHGRQ